MKKSNIFKAIVSLVIISGLFYLYKTKAQSPSQPSTQSVDIKAIDSQIMADGTVHAQNEANLRFLTGGKVIYVPFKEGDTVKKGQTIASLDSYTVQKQIEAAVNTYKSAEAQYNQNKENSKDKVLRKQLITPYDLYSKAGLDGDERDKAIMDAVRRIVDQSKNAANNAEIQVEIAKYALSLSSIYSPFNGVLIHEDIDTPNVVASNATTFTVIDPTTLVFRANIPEDQINYVNQGAKATIKLNGTEDKTFEGTVIKIYPDKQTLTNGQNVYQVDIASDQLVKNGKYEQGGVALITNIYDKKVMFVPSWLILNGKNVWVDNNGTAELKEVKTGNVVNGYTEIIEGLTKDDKLISDPKSVVEKKYPIL